MGTVGLRIVILFVGKYQHRKEWEKIFWYKITQIVRIRIISLFKIKVPLLQFFINY